MMHRPDLFPRSRVGMQTARCDDKGWYGFPRGTVGTRKSGEHCFYLSLASVWEMQIKQQLGKLSLPMPLLSLLQLNQQENDLKLLSVSVAHIVYLDQLPLHHKDPFDRLMIA